MNNNLDIFLITYNRKKFLQETLNKCFEPTSPLLKYSFTILDNHSNDGTKELCEDFAKKYSNITYIQNKRNLGLAGNICKAMELANKEYYWIICDNDKIDYTSWPEIEKAMQEKYDLIMASIDYNCDLVTDKRSFALAESTFLPGCIYKTSYLTDDVMAYALADIYTVLPHVCVACNIVNHNGRIYIPKTSIISLTFNVKIENEKEYSYDRIVSNNTDKLIHQRAFARNFPAGVCSAFKALKDKKLYYKTIKNFIYKSYLNNYGPFLNMPLLYKAQLGLTSLPPMDPNVWKEFTLSLPLYEKIKVWFFIIFPIAFYYQKNGFYIRLGTRFKAKLLKNVKGLGFFDFLVNSTY